jgi:threonine/homoserine/homoserine lactone efflux protein
MTAESTFIYAFAMALFVAAPGPGVFAVIALAISKGPRPAFVMLTGIILGDISFLIAAAAGLGLLAAKMGVLFTAFKYLGAAYLIWLGWKCWTSKITAMPENKGRARYTLLAGFAIPISNPKVMVFYLAFLPPFLDLTKVTASDIGLLASITAVITYTILGTYIFGAAKLRSKISKPTPQKWFSRISGSIMAAAGVLVASRS